LNRIILLFVPCLILSGCGYSTSSRTAKDIKTIAVPFFTNLTAEPNLEITVTEQIIDNLVEDNTLKVVREEQADALLEGRIIRFDNLPFSFNSELNAEEYHVTVTVQATLFNRRLNAPIWENKTFKGDGSYFLDATEAGFTFDSALDEALNKITDRILNLTVQDW
jgi:outer membrane lipopolysaccharide assembly protein LptE/RlpB